MSAFWWALKLIHDQYMFVVGLGFTFSILVAIIMAAVPLLSVRIAGALFVLIFLGSVYLGITGFRDVYTYIHNNGLVGEFVAAKVEGTGNRINDVEVMQYVGYLKVADGQLIETKMIVGFVPHYPISKNAILLQPQEVTSVRYLPSYPSWFVVELGSEENVANAEACSAARSQLVEIEAQLKLSPADAELIKKKTELTIEIQNKCRY